MTPPQKVIARGDHFLHRERQYSVLGMPHFSPPSPISTHRFDVGFVARSLQSPEKYTDGWAGDDEEFLSSQDLLRPLSFGRKKAPPVDDDGNVTRESSANPPSPIHPHVLPIASDPPSDPANQTVPAGAEECPKTPPRNRFIGANASRTSQACSPVPARTTRPRRLASSRIPDGAFAGAQAASDSPPSGDEFLPPAADEASSGEEEEVPQCLDTLEDYALHSMDPGEAEVSDEDPHTDPNQALSVSRPDVKGKTKAKSRNASAGPSNPPRGRPTVEANQEIEEVGHRIQSELSALASKLGLSYDTLLRKMGFAQQEVRDPNLMNVFKQVHKQRLIAAGKGM